MRAWLVIGVLLMGAPGCESEGGSTAPDAGADVSADPGTTEADVPEGTPDTVPGDDGPGTDEGRPVQSQPLEVAEDACCLSASEGRVVWSEAGDVWLYEEATGEKRALTTDAFEQTEPTISGDVVVWADARAGDMDLWMMTLPDGEPEALLELPGNQRMPTLDGDLLAYVSDELGPNDPAKKEIWYLRLSNPGERVQLTDDWAEQTQPHARGSKIVWTDYGADPDGVYLNIADPNENNGDILGHDVDSGETFVVVDDESKQLRAAIDGDAVVWLDWRGINPEPKYSEFQVYGKILDDEIEGGERFLAWSSWAKPGLWQRPDVRDGVAFWIQSTGADDATKTGVWMAPIAGEGESQPVNLVSTDGILEAVVLMGDKLFWLGAGELGVQIVEAIGAAQGQ